MGGIKISEIIRDYNFKIKDLEAFLPLRADKLKKFSIEVHYLGYYLKWIPQETYYYAVKNCDFRPRPFRIQGTYSKYNSIDDKIDDLHYYTTFVKFGIGRATYDVSQELRNDHLNIEEGKKLVKKYDGEFPDYYFSELMKYLGIKENETPHCKIDDIEKNNQGIILLSGSFDGLIGKLFFKNLTDEILIMLKKLKKIFNENIYL